MCILRNVAYLRNIWVNVARLIICFVNGSYREKRASISTNPQFYYSIVNDINISTLLFKLYVPTIKTSQGPVDVTLPQ